MPLNRNRPFGIISPGYHGASFEQVGSDGVTRYYTSQGHEIDIKNHRLVESPRSANRPAKREKTMAEKARDLLEEKDKPPFTKFALKAAALMGGDNPPSTKAEIVAALTELAREPKLVAPAAEPVKTPDPVPPVASETPDPDPVTDANETIDLRAWGRGEVQYVFADVAKAIRTAYSRDVTTRADALDALIDAGILRDGEAMDVAIPDESDEDAQEEADMAAEVKAENEAAAAADAAFKAEAEAAAAAEEAAKAEPTPEAVPEPPAMKGIDRFDHPDEPQPTPETQKKIS